MRIPRLAAAATLLLLLEACRDEQAGPRRRASPQAAAASAAGATLGGGAIRYKGTRVTAAKGRAGDGIQVLHQFEALQAPPPGYRFFVHLVDEVSGEVLQNLDHDFQGGALPEQW
ncbi:MAG: hypothetical protein FJ086_19305, partial [Deltaproteobacteria bacterium]|nr:hypothetical protein [Deltaproteobacteria bacterium]